MGRLGAGQAALAAQGLLALPRPSSTRHGASDGGSTFTRVSGPGGNATAYFLVTNARASDWRSDLELATSAACRAKSVASLPPRADQNFGLLTAILPRLAMMLVALQVLESAVPLYFTCHAFRNETLAPLLLTPLLGICSAFDNPVKPWTGLTGPFWARSISTGQ